MSSSPAMTSVVIDSVRGLERLSKRSSVVLRWRGTPSSSSSPSPQPSSTLPRLNPSERACNASEHWHTRIVARRNRCNLGPRRYPFSPIDNVPPMNHTPGALVCRSDQPIMRPRDLLWLGFHLVDRAQYCVGFARSIRLPPKWSLSMKRFQWAIAMLLLALAQCAYADSIPTFEITQLSLNIFPSSFPGNVGISFTGPGLFGSGVGTGNCLSPPFWCAQGNIDGLLPGASLNPTLDHFFTDFLQGSVIFGGQTHSFENTGSGVSSIFTPYTVTFPTNGQSPFTVSVLAVLKDPLLGTLDTGQNVMFQVNNIGALTLTFDFVPAFDTEPAHYQFTHGTFDAPPVSTVPEPGTLGLMATGLAAIVGVIRKKRDCGCSPN